MMGKRIKLLLLAMVALTAVCAWLAWAATVKIVVEAESYYSIKPSMTLGQSQSASGGKYVYIPLRRPHGENEAGPYDDGNALYKVKIPVAGRYQLWARTHWHDECGNSFFVIVDGQHKSWIGEDGTVQKWHWVKGKAYQLSAGIHTFKFQNREDGAKLDQFLLIKSTRYVPTRPEKETPQYIIRPPRR